ncbi:caspase family protein [Brasilonema bromeliae]|uniref:Caspase family protein n=1 Tax=Brasilonema bromeliae SPC951 TaxID=385972 RepID=A0ABX1PD20_9CYAN|nr:caspase family protein [Brasilonema bromeliae]NMG21667.1 caspase family protein [Brasilonema bromeliae SPC951]
MSQIFTHGYALLVGVGECAYANWSLPVTVKDAQALKSVLTDPNFCAYPNDEHHIRLLHDKSATRSKILDDLEWLKVQAANDSEATVVVYYSGHGWLDQTTGEYYLIQHDVEPFDIPNSALCAKDFTNALRQIKAQRLLVVIDCCHAEGIATAKNGNPAIKLPPGLTQTAPPKNLVDNLKQGEGRAVFTSSRGQQLSWIRSDDAMSIYTYHLIEALQGANNQPGDTVVLISNLMNHLGKSVPESAQTMHQAEQKPFFDAATEDFAIALLLGGKGLSVADKSTTQEEAFENARQEVNATGDRSVAAGRDISNSPITSGNGNTVQIGDTNLNIGKARDISLGKNL